MATLDEMGRLFLPPMSQAASGIGPGDWVEFWVGPDWLALRKVTGRFAIVGDRSAVVHDAGTGECTNQNPSS